MGFRGAVAALAVGASLLFVGAAGAATTGSVTATGTGQAKVTPKNRHNNASIVAAVDAARKAAVKGAIAEAKEYALQYAKAAGLTLGSVLSISDAANGAYGPGPGVFFGPFGPNQYCGTIQQPVFKKVHGHRRFVRSKSVHTCIVPPLEFLTLSVTYNAS